MKQETPFTYEMHTRPRHTLNTELFKTGFQITEQQRVALREVIKGEVRGRQILFANAVTPKFLLVVLALDPVFRERYDACPKPAWARQCLLWMCKSVVHALQKERAAARRQGRIHALAACVDDEQQQQQQQHRQQRSIEDGSDLALDQTEYEEETEQRTAGVWSGAGAPPPLLSAARSAHQPNRDSKIEHTRPARLQLPPLKSEFASSSRSTASSTDDGSDSETSTRPRSRETRKAEQMLDEEDIRLEMQSIALRKEKIALELRWVELQRALRKLQRKRRRRCLSV